MVSLLIEFYGPHLHLYLLCGNILQLRSRPITTNFFLQNTSQRIRLRL